ncbi:MAG: hypothetical protein KF799_12945 [Bdellovibrionales bacterium]|nr:hypothetical protein [Bdellovibrionales bacterium]
MEKISNIVRGNSRVSSVDLKSSSAVRPGTPSYGRPIGEASASPEREGTTASRAAALNLQLREQRRSSVQDRVVENMADQFFMSRIRRPEDNQVSLPKTGQIVGQEPVNGIEMGTSPETRNAGEAQNANIEAHEVMDAPEDYTPRGSYIDVRA